jgi:hypothetical protein
MNIKRTFTHFVSYFIINLQNTAEHFRGGAGRGGGGRGYKRVHYDKTRKETIFYLHKLIGQRIFRGLIERISTCGLHGKIPKPVLGYHVMLTICHLSCTFLNTLL